MSLFGGTLLTGWAGAPGKFTRLYEQAVIDRCNRRIKALDNRIDGITEGRVMPDASDITIGSGRQFELTIMFLDICGFSNRMNWTSQEQKSVLKTMNIFMAEMLSIVHDFGGHFEKNTGDGLMAYFGESEATVAERVKPAAEAALVMHYVNDTLLSPWFIDQGIEPIKFRVGLDHGPVTIARVGIQGGQKSSRVAVGTPANIANKIMKLIPDGGICVGDSVKNNLPHQWNWHCEAITDPSGFVFVQTGAAYIAWKLTHRLQEPLS